MGDFDGRGRSGTGAAGWRGVGRRGVVAALAGLLAVLAVAGPGLAQAGGHTELPDTTPGIRLLLTHDAADGVEVHTVSWGGTDRTVLSSGAADTAPAWSPDGRHVAFLRSEAPRDGLYVVASDGSATTRLADGGHNPSWAPDSARIVSAPATVDEPRPLRITGLDGSSTPVPGTEGGTSPVWAPNGAHIAYLAPDGGGLTVVRPDGSDRRVIHDDVALHPEWSPDSTRVAFVRRGSDRDQLMLAHRDGTRTTTLAEFEEIATPAFAPDGGHLAVAAADGGGSFDVWNIDLADGSAHQLTDSTTDDIRPAWTASATTVGFTRVSDLEDEHATRDVWHTTRTGAPARQITDTGADTLEQFAPGWSIRLAGTDRIATAVELSQTVSAADTVVIARADDHPDALAGGPLAGALDAPVLLTRRDGLAPAVRREIDRLGADHAYLLGGPAALSAHVEDDLADADLTTTRLAGSDRFATAAVIAGELAEVAGDPERVFVVEGWHADPARGWPDALSASGVAAHSGEPILLVTRDRLPAATADALDAGGASQAVIVGGTSAVSPDVQTRLGAHVDDVERLAGVDRYETSVEAADLAVAAGGQPIYPWFATGRDWPDALAAAPAASHDGGVLVLVHGGPYVAGSYDHTERWLQQVQDPFVERAVVVGGPAAIFPKMRALVEGTISSAP